MSDPHTGSIQITSSHLQRSGLSLSYTTFTPSVVKALVVIVHGINDHKARYSKLQSDLARAGFASLAFDQRGFGLSEGARCDVTRYQDYHEDLEAILVLAKKRFPQQKLFLLGHSLGATIAATFCIHFPKSALPEGLAGLILSSPAYKVASLPLHLELSAYLLNILMPTIHIPYPSQHKKRSHDAAVISAVEQDPLIVAKGTPRFYIQFRKMNALFQKEAAQISCPMLILQAGDDRIVDPKGAELLFNQLKMPDKKMINYAGFYHEVFHEIDRTRVVNDLSTWLNEHLSD